MLYDSEKWSQTIRQNCRSHLVAALRLIYRFGHSRRFSRGCYWWDKIFAHSWFFQASGCVNLDWCNCSGLLPNDNSCWRNYEPIKLKTKNWKTFERSVPYTFKYFSMWHVICTKYFHVFGSFLLIIKDRIYVTNSFRTFFKFQYLSQSIRNSTLAKSLGALVFYYDGISWDRFWIWLLRNMVLLS